MQQAIRPYASAGVVLAGAGLIAITPVAGTPPDIQNRSVQLMSTGSPFDIGDLFSPAALDGQAFPITTPAELASDTATNLQDLQNQIAADPAPILEQIIANQAVYSNDLATAAENATSDFTSAVQGLPDVLAQASADFASGDVYDGLLTPYSYLLTSALQVNHDLLNGTSEVVQGITTNLQNLANDTGEAISAYFSNATDSVPTWLSELVVAPFYGPNAALAGFAGVSQDIVTAADNGDYSLVLSDLANAPSTILDAFLNGYGTGDVGVPVAADISSDALRRALGLNPEYGLLTGAAERVKEFATVLDGNQGTIENIYEASVRIANDLALGPTRIADAANDLLSGSTAAGLPDLSTFIGDLSNALDPSTLLGDLSGLFDPSALSDLGAQLTADLGPDLSSVLLSLF